MADSDGEYQADDGSDDEFGDHQVSAGNQHGTRGRSRADTKKGTHQVRAWEATHRTWDTLEEGEDGKLVGQESLEATKRARLLKDSTPLQRGIIRHLVLVLDMSFAMLEKDMLPSRHELCMAYARDFVREYFEQNPISQLAIIGMRDGIAVRISDMSGNPAEHLEKLAEWVKQEPSGSPSLQNALEMCRGALL
jgi:transcription initiation factor TFIIH subunit 2